MASSETTPAAEQEKVETTPAIEAEKVAPPAVVESEKAGAPPPPEAASIAAEQEKTAAPAPPAEAPQPETKALGDGPAADYFPVVNVVLRLLLFASAVVAVVVMATSKQTRIVAVPFPPFLAPLSAKFTHSPAFV